MIDNNGFIMLHRRLIEWEWFNDSKVLHVFLYCLMRANHKPNKWRGINIDTGQFITSRDNIATATGLSVQSIRTALNKLQSTSELTIKTTNRNTVISITNWHLYQQKQSKQPAEQPAQQPTNNQQTTTNNNDNNDNNIKDSCAPTKKAAKRKVFKKPTLQELAAYIADKKYNVDANVFYSHYETNGWKVGKNKMVSWQHAVAGWHSRSKNNRGYSNESNSRNGTSSSNGRPETASQLHTRVNGDAFE